MPAQIQLENILIELGNVKIWGQPQGVAPTNHYGFFMKYNPDIHHRRSIRLKGYDYSSNGAYFITVCTQNRVCLFGDIDQGEMVLNDAGKMVQDIWIEIPEYYDGIEIDTFQIMPNHIHGIIVLVGAVPRACPRRGGQNAAGDGRRQYQHGAGRV